MRSPRTLLASVSIAAAALGAGGIAAEAPGKGAKNWRFPIRGDHDYGGEQSRFGAKRSDGSIHTGHDILARCGTPLIAVHRARVLVRAYSKGTGYYMVLDTIGKPHDFVYAHMKSAGHPGKGKIVKAGRRIGSVGATGASSGVCHLHFEAWKGAWGKGRRIDPIKKLRRWDKHSKGDVVPVDEPK